MKINVMRESLILVAIGVIDLVVTLKLMSAESASEGNPIMSYYLQFGVGAFVLAKLALLILPVLVAEWSKTYKPKFTRLMMRGAIVAYLGSYASLFMVVNIAPRLTAPSVASTPAVIRVAQNPR